MIYIIIPAMETHNIVHVQNKASVRVAEKCGYEWKKTLLKAHTPPKEEPLDMELYERSYEK